MRRPGLRSSLLQPDPLLVDFCLDVAVGGAGDAHADRAGGAMARQADDAHVVGEVLAAELGADAEPVRRLEEFLLQFQVAEGPAVLVAMRGQCVQVLCGCELNGLEAGLGAGAADDEGEVIWGAGGGARGSSSSR